jgi:hypothetical protein
MTKLRSVFVACLTGMLLVISYCANAHECKEYSCPADDDQPRATRLPTVGVAIAKQVSVVVVEVDTAGSHLKEKQRLRIVGPIPAATGEYFMIHRAGNSAAPVHDWKQGPYRASPFQSFGQTRYNLDNSKVKVKTTGAGGHPSPSPTEHSCEAEIVTDTIGVKEIWIQCKIHDGSGTTGTHGGSAHAVRN